MPSTPHRIIPPIQYRALNNNGQLLASLLVGSIPGILITSHFAPRINETILRILLGLVLTAVGSKLLLS